MRRRDISPEGDRVLARYGFPQATLVEGATRSLFVSGQLGPLEGDMAAQLGGAISNLFAILGRAGMTPGDLVKLTILCTDVEALLECWPVMRARFGPETAVPPNTLAQVNRFAHPDALVEIDAIATQVVSFG